MAGLRVELLVLVLVVLTGTLLLNPVRGWEPIDATQLENLYEMGHWVKPQGPTSILTSTDDNSDLDGEYAAAEEALVEGAANGENVDPFADRGFQVEFVDGPPSTWDSGADGGFQEFVDGPPSTWDSDADGGFHMGFVDAPAPPRSWTTSTSPSSSGLDVVCTDFGFQITLLTGSLSDVKVLGSKEVLSVIDAPDYCGYEVNSFQDNLTVPFTGCNVKHTDGYSLQLLYVDDFGQTQVTTASCDESLKFDPDLFPRSSGQPKPTTKQCNKPAPPAVSDCAVASGERVPCGQSGISSSDCEKLGCCVDSSACYYPLDECTADQHFVFAIRHDSASIPVDPTKLVIPGNPNCKPVIVNDKVAIFKFKLTECGARNYMVGETKIYLAEVQTVIKALNLKFGIITRCDPLRFMVECRYSQTGAAQQSLASVGYMVKTPSSTLPSLIISNGLYGVQLRIAEDQTYSSYLPTNSQPLRLLLGNPVYLELRLKSPKPDAVILVNYCLAYPRSAKNALVLIYEGCANPHDPKVSVLKVSDLPKNRHQRRFMVQAFQFMDQKTNKYLDEEIYFMCSTEVCRPAEKTCAERCFDGKAP
ncbi:zona pellucida sperm-binding protein 4-like [Sebastes fasciatus]|uniref:zona pellucida sperm-binding protein 4-like n=1 Tax=Sebastes fasciatus TaxID=394691 RepID=UPI003D9E2F0E